MMHGQRNIKLTLNKLLLLRTLCYH